MYKAKLGSIASAGAARAVRTPRRSLGTTGPGDLQSGGVHARADVAQLAEHITRNDGVLGSIPSVGSKDTPRRVLSIEGGYARYGVDSR